MVSNGLLRVYLWYKNTPFWWRTIFAIWPASELETWCFTLKPLCPTFSFPWQKLVFKHNLKVDKNVFKLCTKISPGRSHFRARTNTMANQEKDLRNSKPLSKLILVQPILRNPGWKSMFLVMLNRGSIILLAGIARALHSIFIPMCNDQKIRKGRSHWRL